MSMTEYTQWAITHPWHVTGPEPRPAVPADCDCNGCVQERQAAWDAYGAAHRTSLTETPYGRTGYMAHVYREERRRDRLAAALDRLTNWLGRMGDDSRAHPAYWNVVWMIGTLEGYLYGDERPSGSAGKL